MPVSDKTLTAARRLNKESAETILSESYPAVVRMAQGLTGGERAAAGVIHAVMARSLRVLPKWRVGLIPSNWFYHHTLLTARVASRAPADARDDLLVNAPGAVEPAYLAFVTALRSLPRQQMEAFLLHHGEKLNPRLLGVAMDCSTAAAVNHLNYATKVLTEIAGDGAEAQTAALGHAYWALTPAEAAVLPDVRRHVRSARWARRLRRLARTLALLAIVALLVGLAWTAWHWREPALEWLRSLRSA